MTITEDEAREIEFYHGTREPQDVDDMDNDALRDEMNQRKQAAEDAWEDSHDYNY